MRWNWPASLVVVVVGIILLGRAQAAPFPLGVNDVMDAYQASHAEKEEALNECYDSNNDSIKFTNADVIITIKHRCFTILSVIFTRPTTFSTLEIPDLLKPLVGGEDWTQKGDKNWESTGNQLTAHWDGESTIVVEAASSGQP